MAIIQFSEGSPHLCSCLYVRFRLIDESHTPTTFCSIVTTPAKDVAKSSKLGACPLSLGSCSLRVLATSAIFNVLPSSSAPTVAVWKRCPLCLNFPLCGFPSSNCLTPLQQIFAVGMVFSVFYVGGLIINPTTSFSRVSFYHTSPFKRAVN